MIDEIFMSVVDFLTSELSPRLRLFPALDHRYAYVRAHDHDVILLIFSDVSVELQKRGARIDKCEYADPDFLGRLTETIKVSI